MKPKRQGSRDSKDAVADGKVVLVNFALSPDTLRLLERLHPVYGKSFDEKIRFIVSHWLGERVVEVFTDEPAGRSARKGGRSR